VGQNEARGGDVSGEEEKNPEVFLVTSGGPSDGQKRIRRVVHPKGKCRPVNPLH